MPQLTVERTYLHLTDLSRLRVGEVPDVPAEVVEMRPCPVATARELYHQVGAAYHWHDRLGWSDDTFAEYLGRDSVRVFELRTAGERGGYFELLRHRDGSVEIAYFGLMAHAFGKGLGRWLLEQAAREAFAWGATRVWLHTCTLDAPSALPNYLARGFEPYARDQYTVTLPGTDGA